MDFLERLNPREKMLLFLTVATVAGAGIYMLIGAISPEDSKWAISSEEVETWEADYQDRIERISDAPGTVREYIRLVGKAEKEGAENVPQDRPDLILEEQLVQWCKEFNLPNPTPEKEVEDIEDVDDYQMIAVTLTIRDADLPRISALLKRAERRGLIIQELSLSNRLDSPSMDCVVKVAEIVPWFANVSS